MPGEELRPGPDTHGMERHMLGRTPARAGKLLTALLAAMALLALMAGAASAVQIYNNVPKPKRKNVVSLGYEATSTSEFGGAVKFALLARKNPTVDIQMSSWACQNLQSGAACHSTPGSTFEWPITLNIYALNGNEPGALIATQTQNVNIRYRPSANNKKCSLTSEGVVGYSANCYNGFAFTVPFTLTGVTLPNEAIVAVAFNTTDYGAAPTHSADVGEDSLNVGLTEPPETPLQGYDPLPTEAFIASTYYPGEGGPGVFSRQEGWEGFQPVFKISASN
jgi:opacity protein-like surface antigen